MVVADQFLEAERISPKDDVEAAEWVAEALHGTSRGRVADVTTFYDQLLPERPGPGRSCGTPDAYLLYDEYRETRGDFGIPEEVAIRLARRQPPLKKAWADLIQRTRDEAHRQLFVAFHKRPAGVKVQAWIAAKRQALRTRVYDYFFDWLLR